MPVSICSFLQLIRSHGALFVFLRGRGITVVMWGWGGVRALYLEIHLRGRALDHLHNTDIHTEVRLRGRALDHIQNTDIHTSPSPLARDQAKEMTDVSSEMGGGSPSPSLRSRILLCVVVTVCISINCAIIIPRHILSLTLSQVIISLSLCLSRGLSVSATIFHCRTRSTIVICCNHRFKPM